MRYRRHLSLVRTALAVCVAWTLIGVPVQAADTCNATPDFPTDISGTVSQNTVDGFSWQTFLALNNADGGPQWDSWSSTDDMLNPVSNGGTPPASGTRYYPQECQNVENYSQYRVLGEVGKVDDAFLEATTKGLSADPVIARNGTFLQYEIMISPPTYNWIVTNKLYDNSNLTSTVTFPCDGGVDAGGKDSPAMSSLVVKLAWMDMTGFSDTSTFHTEDLLIYSPSYRVNGGKGPATCELKPMGLVGMHIAHKTQKQQAWVWSTFEHSQNAPDCTGLPGGGTGAGDGGANQSCNDATQDYNFYPTGKPYDSKCNNVPPSNATSGQTCQNPDNTTGLGNWCLDNPAADNTPSTLCRQVPLSNPAYQPAQDWNAACQTTSGIGVWSNYQLISTQWFTGTLSAPSSCTNISGSVYNGTNVQSVIAPLVTFGGAKKPYLANTSMESYERSNCMGCHSKSTTNETGTTSTEFIYFLGVEVPAAVPPTQ